MPTISPFGLDGNNNQSLSPFDIKGKGRTKIFSSFAVHTPPEYLLKSLNKLKCVVHAPPGCKQGLQKDVLQEEHDSIHHK